MPLHVIETERAEEPTRVEFVYRFMPLGRLYASAYTRSGLNPSEASRFHTPCDESTRLYLGKWSLVETPGDGFGMDGVLDSSTVSWIWFVRVVPEVQLAWCNTWEIVAKSGEASNHSELLVGHHHCIELVDGAAAVAVVLDSCQFTKQLGTVGFSVVLEQSLTSIHRRVSEQTGSYVLPVASAYSPFILSCEAV